MRALSILCESDNFKNENIKNFYDTVQRRTPDQSADTIAYECIFMALHHLASLKEMMKVQCKYSIVRSGIITWYYSIYYASKSMISAQGSSDPQTHASAAKIFQSELIQRNKIISPFSFSISDITAESVEQKVSDLRGQNTYDLNKMPLNTQMALGAAISYLKGTAKYQQLDREARIRQFSDFKQLNVENFRTKAARVIRDNDLRQCSVNFLVQAFRYRGKANYRDVLYLSYGRDSTSIIDRYILDMIEVAEKYIMMASVFVSKRTERGTWNTFVNDINENALFELPIDL